MSSFNYQIDDLVIYDAFAMKVTRGDEGRVATWHNEHHTKAAGTNHRMEMAHRYKLHSKVLSRAMKRDTLLCISITWQNPKKVHQKEKAASDSGARGAGMYQGIINCRELNRWEL